MHCWYKRIRELTQTVPFVHPHALLVTLKARLIPNYYKNTKNVDAFASNGQYNSRFLQKDGLIKRNIPHHEPLTQDGVFFMIK